MKLVAKVRLGWLNTAETGLFGVVNDGRDATAARWALRRTAGSAILAMRLSAAALKNAELQKNS